jgi:hypothetical protein
MTSNSLGRPRSSILPLFITPATAFFYYVSIRGGFTESIGDVVPDPHDIFSWSTDSQIIYAVQWGSHWIYRIFGEIISIGFAAFISAGIARDRASTAAIIAGSTISVGYALKMVVVLVMSFSDFEGMELSEPWYQYLIDFLIIPAAPFIGRYVSNEARGLALSSPKGFAGINRAHFLWLWIPTYWYSLALIPPIARTWMAEGDINPISSGFRTIIYLIPIIIFGVPLMYGLGLLAGRVKPNWNFLLRQFSGVIIIILGFAIGAGFEYGLYRVVNSF